MTVAQLVAAVETRVNDDTSPSYARGEILAALNAAQLLFAFLTLCLERTDTLPVSSFRAHLLAAIPDALVVLRVKSAAGKLRPANLGAFSGANPRWWSAVAPARNYAARGLVLFFDGGVVSVSVTHAHAPATLAADADVPDIPDSYHPLLADYAACRLLLPQSGQELTKGREYLRSFMQGAGELAGLNRTRSLAQRYDTLPPERERFDVSRKAARPDLLPARKEAA